MENKKFIGFAATEGNPLYEKLTARQSELYTSPKEIRSPFARDYTRILHCTAYRRLKHKTQVFYNIESDHVCTRMEHVSHVASVSNTIAKYLGLNDELTDAIACGHDLGHAPFGHQGEEIINKLCEKYLGSSFWHEKNGLYITDNVELLPDHYGNYVNLDLTYAVRDGIVAHCGESDVCNLFPRKEFIDLNDFEKGNSPVTFEGCVVKISDKIAYVGRDIEDAITLGFLTEKDVKDLSAIVRPKDGTMVNTGSIMSDMITDICMESNPEKGIGLSEKSAEILKKIKDFNYKRIYGNERFDTFKKYSELVITELFYALFGCYNGGDVFAGLAAKKDRYPLLINEFTGYISKYVSIRGGGFEKYKNKKIYENISDEKVFIKAALDYVAGMTDRFAVDTFNELITY